MRRFSELTGLPVVEVDSGRVLGRVRDLDVDLGAGRLRGVVVVSAGVRGIIPFEHVYHLGLEAVTVGAEAEILPLEAEPEPCPVGKQVLTREGRSLGRIDDLLIDEESGSVWGYQLSAGLLADFLNGKRSLALTDDLVVGPDTVVVVDENGLPYPSGRQGRAES